MFRVEMKEEAEVEARVSEDNLLGSSDGDGSSDS